MTMNIELLLSAFLIGLAGSGHCLVMCGGISSALSSNIQQQTASQRVLTTLLFHGGRICCYALLGLVVGDLLRVAIQSSPSLILYSRLFAALLLVLIGLYIIGINTIIKHIEARMAFIWRRLQPVAQRFIPVRRFRDALIVGFFWGFLPCGLIYSTLLWTATSAGDTSAALLMLFFGLGTIPALFSSNVLLQKVLTGKSKKLIGILVILFGLWTAASLLMGHAGHAPKEQTPQHHHHH